MLHTKLVRYKGNTNNIVLKRKPTPRGPTYNSKELKFNNGKILKTVELNEEQYNDIGSNVIKHGYNDIIKTKDAIDTTVIVAKSIQKFPGKIKRFPGKIKRIRYMPRKTFKDLKLAVKEISDIASKIKKENYKAAGKQIGKNLVKGSKKTYKLSKKALKPAKSIGNITKAKLKDSGKEKLKPKENEDIGTQAILDIYSGGTTLGKLGTKGVHNVRALNRKIKNRRKLKTATRKRPKTLKKYTKKITTTSKKVGQVARKTSKFIANRVKDIVVTVMRAIVINPITLGIIALILVFVMFFQSFLSIFIGINGTLTIDFGDNIQTWETQMKSIDRATNTKIHSGNKLNFVNSSSPTTWKDVLAVYYVEYGDMTLSDNSTIDNGSSVNTDNPAVWNTIYNEAQSHLGEKYVYGGNSPQTGFDCSGFVQYSYGVGGVSLPRTTYEQCESGEDVTNGTWEPGDLLFFTGSDPQNGLPGHVGIYIGNGQYMQAPQTGDVIKVSNVSDRHDLWGVRRVITASNNSSNSGNSGNSGNSNSGNNFSNGTIMQTYSDLFTKVGKENGVDPILLASIATVESDLNPNEVSSAGASGLCQFMPDTFIGLGFDISEIFDPYTNSSACAVYLKQLLAATNGDLTAALQCYNVGPGAYKACNGNVSLLPAETQAYADKVYAAYSKYTSGGLPNGTVNTNTGIRTSADGKLKKIYDLFIEVQRTSVTNKSSDGKSSNTTVTYTVTKHDLNYVEEKLNMSADQKDLVKNILDFNNFDSFGDEYDFNFNYK